MSNEDVHPTSKGTSEVMLKIAQMTTRGEWLDISIRSETKLVEFGAILTSVGRLDKDDCDKDGAVVGAEPTLTIELVETEPKDAV